MREEPAQLRPQLGVAAVPGGGNAAEKQQAQVLVAVIEDEVGGHDGLLLVGLDHPAHELRQGAATARGRHREAEDDVAAHATLAGDVDEVLAHGDAEFTVGGQLGDFSQRATEDEAG